MLPPPSLTKKCPWIPTRTSYRGDFEPDFWAQWLINMDIDSDKWLKPVRLYDLSAKLKYPGLDRITRVCSGLETGFAIGAKGAARLPAQAENWKSTYDNGEAMCDALQKWITDKLVIGPLTRDQLPKDIRVSPTSVIIKETGAARICMDLSWPHTIKSEVDLTSTSIPAAVNAGIDIREFPVKMVNSKNVLSRCLMAGQNSWLAKHDWSDAYKHVPIRSEDHHLQIIAIGGRYFLDKTATFGCSSSPSLYDNPAEIVLTLACLQAKVPRHYCLRQLDDAMCIGSDKVVETWYRNYADVCGEVGAKLAGVQNPAKACEPSQQGQLLGLNLDLVSWTWSIDKKKADKILVLCFKVMNCELITSGELAKLSGKLTHYSQIFRGKFERGFLLHAFCPNDPKHKLIKPTLNLKSQMAWWVRAVMAGLSHSEIPLPWTPISADPLLLFADAAGPGHGGAGAIAFEQFVVAAYIPWPDYLNNDTEARSGGSLGKNMTTLEAVAGLLALTMDPDRVRNNSVCLITDNMAFYYAWNTGHSRDDYTYTVVKAMDTVARALNVRLQVKHQKRCSSPPTIAADMMSRGMTRDIFDAVDSPSSREGWVSRTLCHWLGDPRPTRLLGTAIVREMATFTPTLSLEVEWEEELRDLAY